MSTKLTCPACGCDELHLVTTGTYVYEVEHGDGNSVQLTHGEFFGGGSPDKLVCQGCFKEHALAKVAPDFWDRADYH